MADGDLITVGKAKFQEVSMVPLCILLRNEYVNKNDIRYSRKLPSYLYLECIKDGTTNMSEPDYANASCGDTVSDGSTVFKVKDKRKSDSAVKLQEPQTIDGISFDGSKSIKHYCICDSSEDVTQKDIACENFSLEAGAKIIVKFLSENTAENPTLNVNNTGAREIWYRGEAIPADYLLENSTYEFVYNGAQYELIGSPGSGKAASVDHVEVETITGYGLQREEFVSAGELRYTSALPNYLRLKCIMPGTTGIEPPDFSKIVIPVDDDIASSLKEIAPHIIVTSYKGITVTARNDSTVLAVDENEGTWDFIVPCFGTWEITALKGEYSNTESVSVDELKNYTIEHMSFGTDRVSIIYDEEHETMETLPETLSFNGTDAEGMFEGCKSLKSIDTSDIHTDNTTTTKDMFSGCESLESIDVSNFNTSNVTNMSGMFEGCESLPSIDISNFDTSNVSDMHDMFKGCANLETIAGTIDMSRITSAEQVKDMFQGTKVNVVEIKGIPEELKSQITPEVLGLSENAIVHVADGGSKVADAYPYNYETMTALPKKVEFNGEDAGGIFEGSKTLASIDTSGIDTASTTNMNSMFKDCEALNSVDVSGFSTENVTDMSGMFENCKSMSSINVSNFNTENVTDMHDMFNGCESIASVDISSFDTSHVADMHGMFENCTNLEEVTGVINMSSITSTDQIKDMFAGTKVASIILSGASDELKNQITAEVLGLPSNATIKINLYKMSDLYPDTYQTMASVPKQVVFHDTDASEMFKYCRKLTTIDTSKIDVSEAKSMSNMFNSCESLTSLDVSNFNTSNVTNMSYMFNNCRALTSLDVSNFNTSNVTDMSNVFSTCLSLTSLDVSNFDTSNVTDMRGVFYYCTALTSLDLSNFNTSNVTDMSYMFGYCRNLTSVTGIFDLSSITDANKLSNMFKNTRVTYVEFKNVPDSIRDQITASLLGLPDTATITIQNTI